MNQSICLHDIAHTRYMTHVAVFLFTSALVAQSNAARLSSWEMGSAADLYRKGIHPRVYLSPKDIDVLREQIKSGDSKKVADAIRKTTKPLIAGVLAETALPAELAKWNSRGESQASKAFWHIEEIALMGVLDEDEQAIEAVRRLLVACPEAEPLGRKGVRRLGYMGTANLARAYDLIANSIPESDRRIFCDWAYKSGVKGAMDQIDAKVFYRFPGGNMFLRGLTSASIAFLAIAGDHDVPELDVLMPTIVPMLEAAINSTIGPDGFPEEDIGYGTEVGGKLALTVEPMRRAGVFDVYAACPNYKRFADAMVHFVQPWGEYLVVTGDKGPYFSGREFVLSRLAEATRHNDILWLMGTLDGREEVPLDGNLSLPPTMYSLLAVDQLKKVVHPSLTGRATAFMDRGRGIVTFRSGWAAEDALVTFDGSQRSTVVAGHAHASCGHFSLYALGEFFSIDTGRYSSEQNNHSIILANGKSAYSTNKEWKELRQPGRLIRFEPGNFVDFASVDSSHQHNTYWANRHLGLVKGASAIPYVWTMEDVNVNDDWAELWWQIQTSPENTIETFEDHATITGWRNGNLLDVYFVFPATNLFPKPHTMSITQDVSTINALNYIKDPFAYAEERYERPSDMVHGQLMYHPRLLMKMESYSGRFMALMLPRRKGDGPPKVEQLACLPGSLAVRITHQNAEDVLIYAYEHKILKAADIDARGNWCVVRRDSKDRRVLDHAIRDGIRLTAGGKALRIATGE